MAGCKLSKISDMDWISFDNAYHKSWQCYFNKSLILEKGRDCENISDRNNWSIFLFFLASTQFKHPQHKEVLVPAIYFKNYGQPKLISLTERTKWTMSAQGALWPWGGTSRLPDVDRDYNGLRKWPGVLLSSVINALNLFVVYPMHRMCFSCLGQSAPNIFLLTLQMADSDSHEY